MHRNNAWPGRETTGVERSISPNGTVRSEGKQQPFANGYGQGTLGTGPVSKPFVPGPNSNQNRTGEDPPTW